MTRLFENASVLITGGSGSFGSAFVSYVLSRCRPRKLVIFSRDEFKQYEMQLRFPMEKYRCLRYYLGDVRDLERLKQAMEGVDYVVHAAAMKQIPASEYNPFECIKTNVNGAENIINAAIYNRVKKVIALSTDKAVNPINLYGATKLASDKIFISGNNMSGQAHTRFSVVRYGNVVGSSGSVVPFFLKCVEKGEKFLPVTDTRMTRFWITLEQGIEFVLRSLDKMHGGEIFVPKIPSMSIVELAKALAPELQIKVVGIRPGEKLHEIMITRDDSRYTVEFDRHFVIQPAFHWWDPELFHSSNGGGKRVPEEFEYSSDKNSHWLNAEDIREMVFGSVQSPV